MSFEPCNENHAITEVVFAVVGLSGFTYDDRSRVKAAHPEWKALLPGQEEPVFNIAVAAPGADQPPPMPPLAFTRFRADGGVDWRLLLDTNALVVNCGSYTRWEEVWTIVRGLFADVAGVLHSQEEKIKSVVLEYLDVFRWIGDDRYDVRSLLQEGGSVPPHIFERGPSWHLHQGWFVDAKEPVPGRILQRMHIDSAADAGHGQVRFNTHHRFDLQDTPDLQGTFAEPDSLVDGLFSRLHGISKTLLADFLTPEMAQRINLNAD